MFFNIQDTYHSIGGMFFNIQDTISFYRRDGF